tara:strand:- start:1573 stop:2109 length:537 start_codon:yes stop_codon:yes gene_type:complete
MKPIVTFLLLFLTNLCLQAQTKINFEEFSIGDNERSSLKKEVKFDLDEIPTFLVIECVAPSINPFNEYNSLINHRLINANIEVDYSGSFFSYFDTEAKNHTVVNAQYKDENDQWKTTGKLVFYIPNSFLIKGENTLTFLNEDNDQRYIDDYFITEISLHKITRKATDSYDDYRCGSNE